jgi:hypothetical protein
MRGRNRSHGLSIAHEQHPSGEIRGPRFDISLTENYTWNGRARWGAGGALYPQPASAGLNSSSRSGASGLATARGVDGKVPRGGERRTRSGPEGSSRKPTSPGDEGKPDLSRRPATSRSGEIDKRCTAVLGRLALYQSGAFCMPAPTFGLSVRESLAWTPGCSRGSQGRKVTGRSPLQSGVLAPPDKP